MDSTAEGIGSLDAYEKYVNNMQLRVISPNESDVEEVRLVRGLDFPVEIYISENTEISSINVIPHWHQYFEILFVLEGEPVLMQNAKYCILHKNDIAVIRPGEVHATSAYINETVRMFVIKFMPDVIKAGVNNHYESKYLTAFLSSSSGGINHIDDSLKENSELQQILLSLVKEFEEKQTGYELFIKGLLFEMIASLVRLGIINMKINSSNSEDIMFLDKLFKYIDNNLSEEITREKAAKFMCMSIPKFSSFFKETTGQTFKEYIDYARVSEAERMIVEKNIKINQVAFAVGFQSVQSFIRTFKRIKGYTPGILLHDK